MNPVKPFQFSRLPVIHFGNGVLSKLPAIVSQYGKKIVLLTGNSSFIQSDHAKALTGAFNKGSVHYTHVPIVSEPGIDMIDRIAADLRSEHPDVVLAIGGGSVMDAGKAVSAMLTVDGSVVDYLEEVGTRQHPGSKIPFIAVPTTAGTGSEATKNAVISKTGKNGFKRSLRHENFVPDIAIVDPALTLSCPPGVTAASGMDCLSQLTEAYLSTKANVYTDALAIEGIRAVKNSLIPAFHDGSDPVARTGMSFAALTSGICLANAGLGVVHGFASSIGGIYDIPHGLICGTLMAASNEISVKELLKTKANGTALMKYAELGKIFAEEHDRTDSWYINRFIDYLHELTVILNLPGLKSAGVEESAIDEICDKTGSKNNPVSLDKDSLKEILLKRFT